MKSINTFTKCAFLFVFITLCFLSCKTTDKISKTKQEDIKVEEKPVQVVQEVKKVFPVVKLTVLSAPSRTTKNVAFSSAYRVKVQDSSGNNLKKFSITASYPVRRNNDSIIYATKEIISDEAGDVYFMPDIPQFSFDEKITFYPTEQENKNRIKYSVSSPFLVRTNYEKESAVVYVFDFDENGKAISNSLAMLRELINSGIKAGNAPISTASYVASPIENLYRAMLPTVGAKGFLVAGSVNFQEPVSTANGVFTCKLKSKITCLDMKTGKVLYSTERKAESIDNTKQKAIQNCQRTLAKETIHAILYGM